LSNNKSIIAVIVVLLIAAGLLIAQNRATSLSNVTISSKEMEILLKSLPPDQLRPLASLPPTEAKKQFVDRVKEIFTLSLEAERLGIASRTDVQTEMGFNEKVVMATLYRDRMAGKDPKAVEVTGADIANYYKENPTAFDDFINSNPRFKSIPTEQREGIKPKFAELMIMVARAKQAGMEKDDTVMMAQRFQRASYLANKAQQELHNTTQVTDDDMKAYYDGHKDQYSEIRARHILVMFPEQREQQPGADKDKKDAGNKPATKEEARKRAEDLLARVKAGEDFAKLAKEFSDDTGSAEQGGDLGFFRKDVSFVPEFKEAVFKLKPGEVSGIVETQYGYHIIKVDEQRIAPFDEAMKAELKDRLVDQKIQDRINALKAKNLVVVDENFTMPSAPPAPMTPGHGQPPPQQQPQPQPQQQPQPQPQQQPQPAPAPAGQRGPQASDKPAQQ
jgi:hypothetical protein